MIKVTGKTLPRVRDTSPTLDQVNAAEAAKALGAEQREIQGAAMKQPPVIERLDRVVEFSFDKLFKEQQVKPLAQRLVDAIFKEIESAPTPETAARHAAAVAIKFIDEELASAIVDRREAIDRMREAEEALDIIGAEADVDSGTVVALARMIVDARESQRVAEQQRDDALKQLEALKSHGWRRK